MPTPWLLGKCTFLGFLWAPPPQEEEKPGWGEGDEYNSWLMGVMLRVGQECLGGKVERIVESPLHSPPLHLTAGALGGARPGCLPVVNRAAALRGFRPAPRVNILCPPKPGGRRKVENEKERGEGGGVRGLREAEGAEVLKPSFSLLPGASSHLAPKNPAVAFLEPRQAGGKRWTQNQVNGALEKLSLSFPLCDMGVTTMPTWLPLEPLWGQWQDGGDLMGTSVLCALRGLTCSPR